MTALKIDIISTEVINNIKEQLCSCWMAQRQGDIEDELGSKIPNFKMIQEKSFREENARFQKALDSTKQTIIERNKTQRLNAENRVKFLKKELQEKIGRAQTDIDEQTLRADTEHNIFIVHLGKLLDANLKEAERRETSKHEINNDLIRYGFQQSVANERKKLPKNT